MRFTQVLRNKQRIVSLALSVDFQCPALQMTEYENLIRSTAYLLSVDPYDPLMKPTEGPYGHLAASAHRRELKVEKFNEKRTKAAAGPTPRRMMDLGWLEFIPREFRPTVHIVCSSHCVAPFHWKDYYPQDWLSKVKPEHCRYWVEIHEPEKEEPRVRIQLEDALPLHHPEGRDIAFMHFKHEKQALAQLQRFGVEKLYLRNNEKLYSKGEIMEFDGYAVKDRNVADASDFQPAKNELFGQVDNRQFLPYRVSGTLAFHTEDRFFATTPEPLPEGLCGAPVLDADGDLCGTVEGIVPLAHKNEKLAGAASFLPSFMMQAFVDYIERGMVHAMMPKELFKEVEISKKTNSIGGGLFTKAPGDGPGQHTGTTTWDQEYDKALHIMKSQYSQEEYDAILNIVEEEHKEVLETFKKEPEADLDEIIDRVVLKRQQMIALSHDLFRRGIINKEGEMVAQDKGDATSNDVEHSNNGLSSTTSS
jgi:hypothetical protein